MTHEHAANHLTEYVLGLLPPDEQRRLEAHVAACGDCRQALQQERAVGHLVRETLAIASRPGPGRLSQLMPEPPVKRPAAWAGVAWRQLAALALLLVLLLGTINLPPSRPGIWSGPSPTSLAVTATRVPTTTATTAATPARDMTYTPRPAGTPLAAGAHLTLSD